ncbi:hypothetical protein CDD80_7559 [Ophiocordyceps camponoti-rufipedis]|uniref:Reverse transcriptase RNase H-like domain-containing protein n=1 Tax=Ophiocordyceps camponoti-rufipedis TaxID=2004952 RepID=A0A2C5ZD38_9HYPO|nr:hypothetical protein CDD80_7559 [Ophiocordyceps camponoti-rufipedis]
MYLQHQWELLVTRAVYNSAGLPSAVLPCVDAVAVQGGSHWWRVADLVTGAVICFFRLANWAVIQHSSCQYVAHRPRPGRHVPRGILQKALCNFEGPRARDHSGDKLVVIPLDFDEAWAKLALPEGEKALLAEPVERAVRATVRYRMFRTRPELVEAIANFLDEAWATLALGEGDKALLAEPVDLIEAIAKFRGRWSMLTKFSRAADNNVRITHHQEFHKMDHWPFTWPQVFCFDGKVMILLHFAPGRGMRYGTPTAPSTVGSWSESADGECPFSNAKHSSNIKQPREPKHQQRSVMTSMRVGMERRHRHLFDGRCRSVISTGHLPLTWFLKSTGQDDIYARWATELRQLKVEIRFIQGARNSAADGLSRTTSSSDECDADDLDPLGDVDLDTHASGTVL